jgi:hypothetical protein
VQEIDKSQGHSPIILAGSPARSTTPACAQPCSANALSLGRVGSDLLSYRREETAYPAGWLHDRLADHYGGEQVFKDVDSIRLGDDFVEVIANAVGSCDVLLVLIGEEWLTITDEHGRRRLDDPLDFVRLDRGGLDPRDPGDPNPGR